MAKIVWDVSMSLDGFTSGPNVRLEAAMGDGGEALHAWMEGAGPDGDVDVREVERLNAGIGAVIVGRRTFDVGLQHWGGTPWAGIPTYVVTHRQRDDLHGENGGTFAFVAIDAAARRAREAAGDKRVMILGAEIARQLLARGDVDELSLHIVPIVLGGGTPMFTGERAALLPQSKPRVGSVTHHVFDVKTT